MLQSSLRTLGLSENAVEREGEEPLGPRTGREPVPVRNQEPAVLVQILFHLGSRALLPGREATHTPGEPH